MRQQFRRHAALVGPARLGIASDRFSFPLEFPHLGDLRSQGRPKAGTPTEDRAETETLPKSLPPLPPHRRDASSIRPFFEVPQPRHEVESAREASPGILP